MPTVDEILASSQLAGLRGVRNAVANRLRGITELLDVDLDDPDQRLAPQLARRARLLA
jgi:hypothetical protein